MSCRTAPKAPILAGLLLALAAPALAQAPLPCRIGVHAKDSHLLAERFDMVVRAEPRQAARTEYRVVVRNPHAWPAAVLTGIDLPGMVEAPAEPVTVPARASVEVTIGWFPLGNPAQRMAPPMVEDVRQAMTVPLCLVLRPDTPLPSSRDPVSAGRLEVVRHEGPHQIRQRL